ncbi:hypothetical protein [Amycolatopsis vastitatis]|uniref:hypothetical protein n=1 Tax=Amycolatopsis vastitatis TaxID=1905142 RepID=UPI00196B2239|nr:hypothetical protein [Amycolatopsis vastitatis]
MVVLAGDPGSVPDRLVRSIASDEISHPVEPTWLDKIDRQARILGYGYGWLSGLLAEQSFVDVEGVDVAPSLIARAREISPPVGDHSGVVSWWSGAAVAAFSGGGAVVGVRDRAAGVAADQRLLTPDVPPT